MNKQSSKVDTPWHVDTICIGKYPDKPDTCEDRAVAALPYLAAAVDGATDLFGLSYDGKAPGWHAADIVARFLKDHAEEIVVDAWSDSDIYAAIDARFEDAYCSYGIYDEALENAEKRFRCGATIARSTQDGLRIIGDLSLARIDGVRLAPQDESDVELFFINLRKSLWHDPDFAAIPEDVKDKKILQILSFGRAGDAAHIPAFHRAASYATETSPLTNATIDQALREGLVGIRTATNKDDLLYSLSLDGFSKEGGPPACAVIPWDSFETVELFSDGYAKLPKTTDPHDWEAGVARAQETDPYRIGEFAAVKRGIEGGNHDDRCLVTIRGWKRFTEQ